MGYEWSGRHEDRPLWLTSSVCYDATDLRLVADLCHRSDVFAIPALNKDVTTFDQMALALHYHMFQMVIVANSGPVASMAAATPTSLIGIHSPDRYSTCTGSHRRQWRFLK